IVLFAVWHDHVQSVDRAALKNADEYFPATRVCRFDSSRQERRRESEADERHAAVAKKDAPGNHDSLLSLKFRRAERQGVELRRVEVCTDTRHAVAAEGHREVHTPD